MKKLALEFHLSNLAQLLQLANSLIKVNVSYKPSQVMEFVGKLRGLVNEQEREIERAVISYNVESIVLRKHMHISRSQGLN